VKQKIKTGKRGIRDPTKRTTKFFLVAESMRNETTRSVREFTSEAARKWSSRIHFNFVGCRFPPVQYSSASAGNACRVCSAASTGPPRVADISRRGALRLKTLHKHGAPPLPSPPPLRQNALLSNRGIKQLSARSFHFHCFNPPSPFPPPPSPTFSFKAEGCGEFPAEAPAATPRPA
jgi:hypothetical protein